ncbi:MAG: hypothetical protein UT02_C0016G0014 [Parcubacteria group bacterium GW2011_GWC2_38_7]|nr:MAG: hypothetical protein UT02_C0016G0014 [Parcubacteria group bacterium GW2011_GWC2_38_7]
MKTFVLSLGGAIVVPEEIDTNFLKKFKKLILKYSKNNKFYIIVGGGRTCRKYQAVLRGLGIKDSNDLDWTGVAATRLNATLVRSLFGKSALSEIITDPNMIPRGKSSIIIGGGWKPGWSTDYVAVSVAKKVKAEAVINLSNIDYIYSEDPQKQPKAKPLSQLSWPELRALVGSEWVPGMNLPFDPIACKLAEKQGVKLIVANGRNLSNLEKIILGKQFFGTEVS